MAGSRQALGSAAWRPVTPIEDMRRIAFLLERANEASYRVKAFRSAATALSGHEPPRRSGRRPPTGR